MEISTVMMIQLDMVLKTTRWSFKFVSKTGHHLGNIDWHANLGWHGNLDWDDDTGRHGN